MKERNLNDLIEFFFNMWRHYKMYKQTMSFVRGIGTGLVAGMALAKVGNQMMKNNRGFRRRSNKTLQAVGDLVNNLQYLFQ